jgi:hypothetical protein
MLKAVGAKCKAKRLVFFALCLYAAFVKRGYSCTAKPKGQRIGKRAFILFFVDSSFHQLFALIFGFIYNVLSDINRAFCILALSVKPYLDNSGKRICLYYNTCTVGSYHPCINLGSQSLFRKIGVIFIAQTAHKTSAGSRYFSGVNGEVLLLCHFYGNLNEVAKKLRAA